MGRAHAWGIESRCAKWAVALCLLLPARAQAFELSRTQGGVELTWQSAIEYDAIFGPDDHDFSLAARRAFDRWALASQGALTPNWHGPSAGLLPGDGRSTLGVASAFDPTFGDPRRTVAHTEVLYDTTTGVIREADIYLNGETFTFGDGATGAFDAESVLVHELGHGLGLAHTCGDPGRTFPSCFSVPDVPPGNRLAVLEAVMAPTLSVATLRRELTADDEAGIRAHFPGTSTVPRAPMVSRRCPSGELEVDADPAHRLVYRYENGRLEDAPTRIEGAVLLLAADPRADSGDVDLMVIEPNGAYAVGYRYASPTACAVEPPPPPPEGGCSCRTERSPSRQGPWLLVTLGSLLVGLLRSRLSAAVILGLVLLAPDAQAFKCSRVATDTGPSFIWETRTIGWYGDTRLDQVFTSPGGLAEVQASFQVWTDVDCSDLSLPFLGTRDGLKAEYLDEGENLNAVILIGTGWAYDPLAIAVTTNAYDRRTGVVVDADIEINAQEFEFRRVDQVNCGPSDKAMDLRNAITHEVGHVIGLDHPPDAPRYAETTMYARAPPCETKKRTLAEDDRSGLCTIYPTGLPTMQCFPPDGPSFVKVDSDDGFGCTSARGPTAWALVIVFFAFARLRRD